MGNVHFSSSKDDWGTPQNIRNAVFAFACGEHMVFDPCPGKSRVGTLTVPRETDDGLAITWPGDQSVTYVNPPYGRQPPKWVQKAIMECAAGSTVIMLVPARTDTQWFHQALNAADATCLLRGRLTFLGAKDPAPFPSAVFLFGDKPNRFAEIFGAIGNLITPTERVNG